MTENETKLIEMIRNHPNPEEALIVAFNIIISVINDEDISPEHLKRLS